MSDDRYLSESNHGLHLGVFNWLRRPPAPALRRWERPELKQLLGSEETLLWADVAMTGILGHPWIKTMPGTWGSGFWDTAWSRERFIAVELPVRMYFNQKWKMYSIPWSHVTRAELRVYTGPRAVIVDIQAPDFSKRFNLAASIHDFAGVERALRKASDNVVVKTGLFWIK